MTRAAGMTCRSRCLQLAGRTVLVIGDLMLDHFVIGRVDRISPEAPVPVVRFDHESTGSAAPPTSPTTSPRWADASR